MYHLAPIKVVITREIFWKRCILPHISAKDIYHLFIILFVILAICLLIQVLRPNPIIFVIVTLLLEYSKQRLVLVLS